MKFSEQTQSFYPDDITYTNMPTDAVAIDQSDYQQLYAAIINGSHVYFDGGKAIASTPRPDSYHSWGSGSKGWVLTDEAEQQKKADEVAAAVLTKQELTDTAMESISVIQLKLQAGRTLTDTEKSKLNATLDYIDAVEAIDTSIAPAILWPQKPQ